MSSPPTPSRPPSAGRSVSTGRPTSWTTSPRSGSSMAGSISSPRETGDSSAPSPRAPRRRPAIAGSRYPAGMALVLDYIELAVGDVAEAKAFYGKALGWTFNDYGPDYAGLQDPRNPGQEFGGLNADK